MIDLIYLAHNRLEFTKASLHAVLANTDWSRVGKFLVYDDSSRDGTREYLEQVSGLGPSLILGEFGSPVNVMRDYLANHRQHSIFAKIDSDTMVPPGWLDECLGVMEREPDLDLLGIEAFNPVMAGPVERSYTQARFIGGIGLMRARAFESLPEPNGRYFGFTEWQERNPQVKKGWIAPSLPVFLLDRLPMEPWRSLSKKYVEEFGQRDWGPYDVNNSDLWVWWKSEAPTK
jgi:hypothetical protein